MSENTLEISSIVAATLGLISHHAILSSVAYRDAESDFVGGVGDTVRVRVPQIIEARDGSVDGATQFSDIEEHAVPVELSVEAYSAVKLSDRELTLKIEDFGRQVLNSQAMGIVRKCEQTLAEKMNEVIASSTREIDPDNPLRAMTEAASEFLRRENGRSDSMVFVIGPALLAAFLNNPTLQNASALASDDVIRGGRLGRLLGFDVYASPYIDGAISMSRDAFALAVRAPESSDGMHAETQVYDGYAIRALQAFVVSERSTVNMLSTFVGAVALDEQRYVAFQVGSGNGGNGTQGVRIVADDTTVPVNVTDQPIQVESSNGTASVPAASDSPSKAVKTTKAKSAA